MSPSFAGDDVDLSQVFRTPKPRVSGLGAIAAGPHGVLTVQCSYGSPGERSGRQGPKVMSDNGSPASV